MSSELRNGTLQMEVAGLGPENPLPRFRSPQNDLPLPVRADLPPDELADYGRNQMERTLPHRLQDRYDRRRVTRTVPTLVLENERLRAEFVPDWGGRLWSLYDKTRNRELLHRNPVFQPANFALRQAWVSGGIEWNMGRIGHHDYTLSPLFAARVREPGGEPVLRLYEWDRVSGFPWQIDFALPSGSRHLWARMRLVNPHDSELSNYWWTNIAVEETPDGRVLAPASAYLGLRQSDQALAFVDYPTAPDGRDLSYTGRGEGCSEHFFRIPRGNRKWIAYVEADGRGFAQVSTDRLRGRKCFSWGVGPGGRRWQEFLGAPGRAYLEIQAGLATSQYHSVTMPPRAEWTWTEAFGPLTLDPVEAHGADYTKAWQAGERALESLLPRAAVDAMDGRLAAVMRLEPDAILHEGSGWGALERRRLKADNEVDRIPPELVFTDSSLGPDQAPWRGLLETGEWPERDPAGDPGACLVQAEWRRRLEAALVAGRGAHWAAWYHAGVMRMEHRDPDAAVVAWGESMRRTPSCWAARCLAVAAERGGRPLEAVRWLEQAWTLNPRPVAAMVAVEWVQTLNRTGRHLEALEACEALPPDVRQLDRLRLEEARAAIMTNRFDRAVAFFEGDFAVLRECEQSLTDLWFLYQERRLSLAERIPIDRPLRERVRRDFPPPHAIAFG
jgi:hypothetical protein